MEKEEQLVRLFDKVQAIINKNSKLYFVKGWEREDYLQEGRIVLHQLLEQDDFSESTLYVRFKVKFKQHLIDYIRRTQAQKRQYDYTTGIDVHECAEWLTNTNNSPEHELVYQSLESEVFTQLSPLYQSLLKRQLSGEILEKNERSRLKKEIKAVLFA
ncbi:MAG: sigma-70 family RNA polymerase sigma factor [Streptococcaceae bacterium]|nr:sigma-70 family RNA polymerase sigma factor [Streptococcaceae bacterium]MCL2858113.1 sigma-70 family RNA polymerase sigma factor [Streptococcaceae bacterium]